MRTEAQLRQVFHETFDALPQDVRSQIETLWLRYGVQHDDEEDGHFNLKISKETTILDSEIQLRPRQIWEAPLYPTSEIFRFAEKAAEMIKSSRGRCGQTNGVVFWFKASVVDNAPGEMLKIVIAHELAHAYSAAQVGVIFPDAAHRLGRTLVEEETNARSLARQWGFDDIPLYAWIEGNAAKLFQ